MKNIKVFFSALMICLLGSQIGHAQFYDNGFFTLGYNMGMPAGGTSNFVDDGSYRNFSVEGAGFVYKGLAIGGRLSYDNFFQDYGRGIYDNGQGSDIYANKYNYLNMMNLQVTASYYFNRDGLIQPYVGLAMGGSYVEQRTDYGMLSTGDQYNGWAFSVAPEVGVYIPFGGTSDWGATVRMQYNFINHKAYDSSGINYYNFGIGITHRF
ncbi:hypothetical protein [Persicobacter psychrovividus]|uniref:Outer membrane protein beta-barrel domain-containing protein n=1 Tax=Persicobacter psychrovividus TaxID=387638 RepID=A0ABM7VKK9_9BACT|nr:hypothetical protein PEPS_38040 [Persicobacter psychrovividus]